MTEEDKNALAGEIADELEDSAYGIGTGEDRHKTALLVIDRAEHWLWVSGWMPPATYERIREWASRTAHVPDKHVNRDTLTAHLAELSGILHDR